MELKTIANEYAKGVEKTTDEFKKFFGAMVLEERFEPEHLEMIQNLFGVIDKANKLIVKQAETIQEINEKLDKLLENK
jgi:hypothetical protein